MCVGALFHACRTTGQTIWSSTPPQFDVGQLHQPQQMDKEKAILRFKALMRYATSSDDDVGVELNNQQRILYSLGVSPSDINNLIHDRHGHSTPEVAALVKEIEAERWNKRRSFGVHPPCDDRVPPLPSEKIREEHTAEYLRATGGEAGAVHAFNPVPSEITVALGASSAVQERAPTPPENALQVPYGLDISGALIHANCAIPFDSYFCPCCRTSLVLCDGEHNANHFAHRADTECTDKSVLKVTAKLLLIDIVGQHVRSLEPVISLECICSECKERFDQKLQTNAFSRATTEHRTDEFVCDVLAWKEDTPALAIAVLENFAAILQEGASLSLPWIELDVAAVLENPRYWRPRHTGLKPVVCPSCKQKK